MHTPLEQLRQEIGTSLSGLDAAQTQLRPADDPARWSVQQLMEHLLLTYALTCKSFEVRIAKGTPTRSLPSLPQRVGQYAVCRFGYFPHGRKAPAVVTPSNSAPPVSGDVLAAQASDVLARLEELAVEAERLFGERRFATHHVLGSLNASQWLRFHLVHGQHHLRQIRAIRTAHGV